MADFPIPLPTMFSSWGWPNNDWDATAFAERVVASGYKSVGVRADCTFDEVMILKNHGLFVVRWANDAPAHDVADKWCPQIEGPIERDQVLNMFENGWTTDVAVTTYGGLDNASDVASFIEKTGIRHYLIECYAKNQTVESRIGDMIWQGTQYGFDRDSIHPLIGVYGGEFPYDYTWSGADTNWRNIIRNNFGIYQAEPMWGNTVQWEAWTNLIKENEERLEKAMDIAVSADFFRSSIGKKAIETWRKQNPKEAGRYDQGDNDLAHYATNFGRFLVRMRLATS